MSVDFAAQRQMMVESQVRVADVTDYAIQDAMRMAPREALLPPQTRYLAYADMEVEYAPGRWLLKGRDVGKLLQALKPRVGERALAIAAPYAAAVLAAMGLVVTRHDDGDLATPFGGPYDLAVCEGAVTEVPAAWWEVLELGGRLAAVERAGPVGRAVLYVRTEGGAGRRDLFDCTPPIMAGFGPQPAFTF